MFENLLCDPIADRCKRYEVKESGRELLVSHRDGAFLLDALKEILNMMAVSVMASVKWNRTCAIGFWWNAGLQVPCAEEFAKLIRVVGFVGENRLFRESFNEIKGSDQIVPISGCSNESEHATFAIDESMNLGIRTTSGCTNELMFSALRAAKSVFVNFNTGRIDRPKLPFEIRGDSDMDFIPNSLFAPLLPAGVNRGMWSENTQGPPTAPFPKSEKQGMKNCFDRYWRTSAYRPGIGFPRTLSDSINFFRTFAVRRSFS